MKEYPILFSGPLVNAILAGRKTQTRRLATIGTKQRRTNPWAKRKAGDVLWVRETWAILWKQADPCECWGKSKKRTGLCPHEEIEYRADANGAKYPGGWPADSRDDESFGGLPRWRPSIHMPRWASRILLRLTVDARVEPLHAMKNADAVAEGIIASGEPPLLAFANLWDQINNRDGVRWRDNPDVVVLTFDVVNTNRVA